LKEELQKKQVWQREGGKRKKPLSSLQKPGARGFHFFVLDTAVYPDDLCFAWRKHANTPTANVRSNTPTPPRMPMVSGASVVRLRELDVDADGEPLLLLLPVGVGVGVGVRIRVTLRLVVPVAVKLGRALPLLLLLGLLLRVEDLLWVGDSLRVGSAVGDSLRVG
jgi:hypothetical protein